MNSIKLTENLLHILQHSLGCDQYGQGSMYRNRFVTGEGSTDWPLCQELVQLGLMEDAGRFNLAGGDNLFFVTDSGIAAMKSQSQRPPNLTRSQQRYQTFLRADLGISFREYLKMEGKLTRKLLH